MKEQLIRSQSEFNIITDATLLTSNKIDQIETLCNHAFCKNENSSDSFNGILAKKPGIICVSEDPNTGIVNHVSIFETIPKHQFTDTLIYLSLAATAPKHQNQGLGSKAIVHVVNRLFDGHLSVIARTQNPIELSSFRRAALKLGATNIWPLFNIAGPSGFKEVSALVDAKANHPSKTIWDGNTTDLRKGIALGAYKNLDTPNMIKMFESQINWNNPTAKLMAKFWNDNHLDRNNGDAIFMVFRTVLHLWN